MSHFAVAVISQTLEDVEKLLAPYQENNMCDCPKEFLAFTEDEDCEIDEETGKRGYWGNPNRQWDWYTVGGRWKGLIKTKDGRKVDFCQIGDIDPSPDQDAYAHAIRFWEINVEGQALRPDEREDDFWCFFKPKYYLERFGTKESYAEDRAAFITFAMVTADGVWHEKGSMGWFGCDDSTESSISAYAESFKKALEEADQSYFLTVVDCHI